MFLKKIRSLMINPIFFDLVASILIIIMIVWLILNIFIKVELQSISEEIGKNMGTVVGTAVGSWKGITEGRKKGSNEGKQIGLSAEDTQVSIDTKIKKIGRLNVLAVDLTQTDVLKLGKDSQPTSDDKAVRYADLRVYSRTAYFSVDLSKSKIVDGKTLEVILPDFDPINLSDGEIIAEDTYQAPGFIAKTGNTSDGFVAHENARSNGYTRELDKLENYDNLREVAKNNAIKQITTFVKEVYLGDKEIVVRFESESESEWQKMKIARIKALIIGLFCL